MGSMSAPWENFAEWKNIKSEAKEWLFPWKPFFFLTYNSIRFKCCLIKPWILSKATDAEKG